MSKVGVSALARILQKEQKKENKVTNDISPQVTMINVVKVVVNHAHPGWMDTDMTRGTGHWPVSKGTTSVLWAATLPIDTEVLDFEQLTRLLTELCYLTLLTQRSGVNTFGRMPLSPPGSRRKSTYSTEAQCDSFFW